MLALAKAALTAIGAASFLVFLMGIVIPIGTQITYWLKHAVVIPRDGYWLIADVSCEKTGGKAMGFQGMDICRRDGVFFTDMLGVNHILNLIADLHVAVYACVISLGLFLVAIVIANWIGEQNA